MYLTEFEKETGLIKINPIQDGIFAIEDFRNIFKWKKGHQVFTCVALVIDYMSPIRYYPLEDRKIKAMDIVFQDRKAFMWNNDEILLAMIAYEALQYDAILEEKKIIEKLRDEKLSEIQMEDESAKKTIKLGELKKIKDILKTFTEENNLIEIINKAPVVNGYEISRLELLLTDKNSFYHVKKRKQFEPGIGEKKSVDEPKEKPVAKQKAKRKQPTRTRIVLKQKRGDKGADN